MQRGALETGRVGDRDGDIQECPLEFTSSTSMHHITFEEGKLYMFVFECNDVYHLTGLVMVEKNALDLCVY